MPDPAASGKRPTSVWIALIVFWLTGLGFLLVQALLFLSRGTFDWGVCGTGVLLLVSGALNLSRRPLAIAHYLGGIALIVLTVRCARTTWNQFLFAWDKSQHVDIAMVPYLSAVFTALAAWLAVEYISGERSRAYFSL